MTGFLTLTALLLTPLVAIHAADAPKTPGGAVTTPPVPLATVTERRLPNGDSELQLLDAQGKMLETAVVNLSRHHQPATAADDPLITKWRSWKYGAFLCYNSNQFSGSEHCTIRDAKQYAPTDLNIRQWAQTLKAAGMKYAVLTTSHTSGFLLWDSPTSEFDVANSGNPTDVVKGYVEECRSHDIIPGLYFPTDILNGELTMPPATGHQASRTVGGTGYYLPFEYEPCSQSRPKNKDVWFTYGTGKSFVSSQPYPAVKLAAEITQARRRGASNVLLSCAPDHTGKFREEDVRQLTELGRLLDSPKTDSN